MKDPAFLFYSSDFLSGISDLTMDERGQYITLLCLQHQKGVLTDKIIGLAVGVVSGDVLAKFVQDEQGNYYNIRLQSESGRREEFIKKQVENGKKGGRPKNPDETQTKPNQNPTLNPNDNPNETNKENENENRNEDINRDDIGGMGEKVEDVIIEQEGEDKFSFDKIWTLYGKKGNKKTSSVRWENISVKAKNLALEHIPKYVDSTPDITYRKNFETYINQEAWNDEIIHPDNGKSDKNHSRANAARNEKQQRDEEFRASIAADLARAQAEMGEQ